MKTRKLENKLENDKKKRKWTQNPQKTRKFWVYFRDFCQFQIQTSPPPRSRSPIQPHQTLMVGQTRRQGCQSQGVRHFFRPHQRNLKVDSRYTGSDIEEDDFNDFSMNKGFIQYDL